MEKLSLINALWSGDVVVTFTKKDGSERVMKCTLQESKIPQEYTPKGTERKVNDNVLAVFDVENQGWRSFRFDSVKNFTVLS